MDVKYFAGFIDGEGSITIAKRKETGGRNLSYYLRLGVSNTHEGVILGLQKFFKCGAVREIIRKNRDHRTIYFWEISCEDAYEVLKQLFPHLVVKKAQCQLGMFFQIMKQDLRGRYRSQESKEHELEFREQCYQQMKRLNAGEEE